MDTCNESFFDGKNYKDAINQYKKNIKKFDTLVGSNAIQDFIFNQNKPVNYNPKKHIGRILKL